jgi:hypothetical protein
VRQVVTTKDLREMCLNGVTLDDIRSLYGVHATLEDIEPVLPPHLIDDLGMFPCREVATKSLSASQIESVHAEELEVNPDQNVGDENEKYPDVAEEETNLGQDEREDEASPIEIEKGKALPLLFSADQQVAKEVEPEVPSLYNQLPSTVLWHTLLTLCLFAPNSNMLDVLASLEILSHLDGNT